MKTARVILLTLVLLMMIGTSSADFVPETYTVRTINATYIDEENPNTNFNGTLFTNQGGYTNLNVAAMRESAGIVKVVYVKINVTEPVSNAKLYYQVTGGAIETLSIYRISNDWDVNTITWNSGRPSTDYTSTGTILTTFKPTLREYIEYDITDIVSGGGTYSFVFRTSYGGGLYLYTPLDVERYPYMNLTSVETFSDIVVNNGASNANDSNNGTSQYPFKTLNGALTRAKSTCNISVVGNTVDSLMINRPFDNLNIVGVNNPTILSNENVLTLANTGNVSISGITFSSLSTSTSSNTIVFGGNTGSNITFSDCEVYSNNGSPVVFSASSYAEDVLFENVKFISNSLYPGYGVVFSEGGARVDGVKFKNCTVEANHGGTAYQLGFNLGPNSGKNCILDNVSISSGKDGLGLAVGSSVTDSVFSGLKIYASRDTSLFGSGIHILSGNNNTIRDSDIYYAKYTGIKPNRPTNTTFSNITLHSYYPYQAYTHNAVEIKGSYNIFSNIRVLGFNNTTPYPGESYHVFYGAGTEQEKYNLVENCYSENTKDRYIGVGGHQENFIFRNITGVNHTGQGLYIVSFSTGENYKTSDKIVFDNISLENNGTGSADFNVVLLSLGSSKNATSTTDYTNISLYGRETVTFIDTRFSGTNTRHWWMVDDGAPAPRMFYGDVYAINPSHTSVAYTVREPSRFEGVLHFMYYPKIRVVNPSGKAIAGATISFVSNATNPETGGAIYAHNLDYGGVEKAYTDKINSSQTLNTGYLPSRYENASGAVALTSRMSYYTSSPQSAYVQWDVTATKNGQSQTITITPDMLAYSPDSSDIQSTLVTLTLDVEGHGEPEEPVTPPVDPQEPRDRMSGPETAIALIGVLLVVLVATAILGSLAGLITGVIDMQQTAAIVVAMVLVAVLAFVGLAVLSGISGALNL